MGAKENIEIIEQYQQAVRDQDSERAGSLLADNAVARIAGVPRSLGGVTEGREAVLETTRQNTAAGTFEMKQLFADDNNVCMVGKITATSFPGNQFLRSGDRPYTTYQCVVYRLAGGQIVESTAYVNWLDPYVQTGIIDAATLTT